LGLGYIYRQTHRITPSIIVHMLFNGFALLILWLSIHNQGGP
jgi:membrane protease YdiL (CAAX protease family)